MHQTPIVTTPFPHHHLLPTCHHPCSYQALLGPALQQHNAITMTTIIPVHPLPCTPICLLYLPFPIHIWPRLACLLWEQNYHCFLYHWQILRPYWTEPCSKHQQYNPGNHITQPFFISDLLVHQQPTWLKADGKWYQDALINFRSSGESTYCQQWPSTLPQMINIPDDVSCSALRLMGCKIMLIQDCSKIIGFIIHCSRK